MRAIIEHGPGNLRVKTLETGFTGSRTIDGQLLLDEAEDDYIRILDTITPNGWNSRGGGSAGPPSLISLAKMREAHRGHKVTPATRAKQAVASTGRRHTEAAKEKIGASGRTPEGREKRSAPHRGVPKSPSQRAKMSAAAKAFAADPKNKATLHETALAGWVTRRSKAALLPQFTEVEEEAKRRVRKDEQAAARHTPGARARNAKLAQARRKANRTPERLAKEAAYARAWRAQNIERSRRTRRVWDAKNAKLINGRRRVQHRPDTL